ncbi:MAG TPA: dTMP kinase [Microlunatus sp.]|nr:dTMP kinase [Microlunatus sp.]
MSGVRTGTGLFVVFEGGDGVGKSTQVGLLCEALAERGIAHLRTYEPGDSAAGQQIRRIVLDPATGELAPRAEALLYAADKAHHVSGTVLPALEAGRVVVCDRYVDSMLAYQGAGRVLDLDEVERVARWATGDLRPHLTVLLDVHPDQALTQIAEKDRLEAAGSAFHDRARQLFLTLAAREPEHYLVLGARENRTAIAERVLARVTGLLAARGLSDPAGTLAP